jgi:NAD(P)-dependent dehydrogenase (short-subunit alcohol dehydrogenase family)
MRLSEIPVGRLGTVDDMAAACVYLAGDTGGFITGQVIHLNGGQFMY